MSTNPTTLRPDPRAHDEDRPCARDQRCSAATIDPDTGRREPAHSPRPLCDTDRDLLQVAIGQLPRMYVRVHQALLVAGASSNGGPKVTTSKSPGLLINTSADELLRLLTFTLVSWEERVREVAHLSPLDTELSRRRRDSVALQQAVKILEPRVDALLALDFEPMMRDGEIVELDGEDAALELFQLHWKCRAVLTDTSAPAEPLKVPCRCGLRQLVQIFDFEDRPDGAVCRQCRAEHSQQQLVALEGEKTADARTQEAARMAAHRVQREEIERARAAELAVHHLCRGDTGPARQALAHLSAAQRERVAQAGYALARLAGELSREG
ncbi:hypothetical protein [Acrocarpospora sp. B8E8]|uniref:hypothetical protein n=1 Tax=Acrocarpospora sp. B8E8 TaxID=3153572 RepID=UPI00325E294F